MPKQIDESLFDSRVVKRNIDDGRITSADYKKWLAGLPDEAEEGEETETRMTAPAPEEDA